MVLSGGPEVVSLVADVLALQVARVRLQLVLLLSLPLPLPVHEGAGVSEARGHPGGEGGQSHGDRDWGQGTPSSGHWSTKETLPRRNQPHLRLSWSQKIVFFRYM